LTPTTRPLLSTPNAKAEAAKSVVAHPLVVRRQTTALVEALSTRRPEAYSPLGLMSVTSADFTGPMNFAPGPRDGSVSTTHAPATLRQTAARD
jgi:hypothetical protein